MSRILEVTRNGNGESYIVACETCGARVKKYRSQFIAVSKHYCSRKCAERARVMYIQGDPPCDNCKNYDLCKYYHLSCPDFGFYLRTGRSVHKDNTPSVKSYINQFMRDDDAQTLPYV